jgi:hypothetical protein
VLDLDAIWLAVVDIRVLGLEGLVQKANLAEGHLGRFPGISRSVFEAQLTLVAAAALRLLMLAVDLLVM